MSISSVVNDFLNRGLECSVINRFEVNSKFKKSLKENILEPVNYAKTLVFRLKNTNIIIITEKNMVINHEKFWTCFKVFPKELSGREAHEVTGHPIDGLSPFGLKNPLKTYIDISLKQSNFYNKAISIYICAGMKNYFVRVTPEEITNLTGGKWIDVCSNKKMIY